MGKVLKYIQPEKEIYKRVCVAFASDDKDKIAEFRELVKADYEMEIRRKNEKLIDSVKKAKTLLGE